MVKRYRKKPVVVEAIQWTGDNFEEVSSFLKTGNRELMVRFCATGVKAVISTLEGDMLANPGDMIIKGVDREFYPCKPKIFEQTYTEEIE